MDKTFYPKSYEQSQFFIVRFYVQKVLQKRDNMKHEAIDTKYQNTTQEFLYYVENAGADEMIIIYFYFPT